MSRLWQSLCLAALAALLPASWCASVLPQRAMRSVVAAAAGFGLVNAGLPSSSVLAVVDCQTDCYKNCLLAAPQSQEYCKLSCTDYCADPDREDGLSGSKSNKEGEQGIFGGTVDSIIGTTVVDRPPSSPFNLIDPKLSSQYGKSASRVSAEARHK